MGPQNGIVDNLPPELQTPQSNIDEKALNEEKNLAKYSKTKEFKAIKEYWEARIEFFQKFLPFGGEVRYQVPNDDIAQQWVLANNMINEIQVFLNRYENAKNVVDEANKGGPGTT